MNKKIAQAYANLNNLAEYHLKLLSQKSYTNEDLDYMVLNLIDLENPSDARLVLDHLLGRDYHVIGKFKELRNYKPNGEIQFRFKQYLDSKYFGSKRGQN